ncbi:MAG: hypothetical protein IPG59_19200 [Candidatus Melainabacteria bacterium]|nr:MAG: hypothetical protein IPG59_19200 [Candidatus Melainabacteria bacterium]
MRLRNTRRSNSGAAMLMIILICVAALAVAIVTGVSLIKFTVASQRAEAACEAASLTAVKELSKIVIDDPNFGLIGLGNYAPSETGILAGDGKPLPVVSINSVMASARVAMLLSERLGSAEFRRLATHDALCAQKASANLTSELKKALSDAKDGPKDINQELLKPRAKAFSAIKDNLKGAVGNFKIKEFDLQLGYLKDGSTTVTQSCKPEEGIYQAFKNYPVSGHDFIFTGVGKQSCLVDRNHFAKDDGRMPSSVVKVSLVLERSDEKDQAFKTVAASSCAQPYSLEDKSKPGTMNLSLPQGLPQECYSIQNLLEDTKFGAFPITYYTSLGGDYPLEPQARLAPNGVQENKKHISSVFAQGLYDWIRSANGKVKIDSVVNIVNSRLYSDNHDVIPGQSIAFSFNQYGEVKTKSYSAYSASNQLVHENQFYTIAWDAITTTTGNWTFTCRDQVRNLGLQNGGKHAGQLMENTFSYESMSAKDRKVYNQGGLAVEFVLSCSPIASIKQTNN